MCWTTTVPTRIGNDAQEARGLKMAVRSLWNVREKSGRVFFSILGRYLLLSEWGDFDIVVILTSKRLSWLCSAEMLGT